MTNGERKNRIEEFLLKLSRIKFEDPAEYLSRNMVYSLLTDLGVEKKTYNKEELKNNFYAKKCRENQIEYLFKYWVDRFYYRDNTECFVSEFWKYFCQFKSEDVYKSLSDDPRNMTHIKLYIPLDSRHIRAGANMIFDFLDQNKISHLSKIGKEIRFDDVVVRLYDEDDARKLISYVGSNAYIQEGLIKANPFLYSKNGVAMTFDGNLSCNSCLADIICEYINNKKDKKGYNGDKPISYDDFYEFMLYMYNEIFNKNNSSRYRAEMFFEEKSDKKTEDLRGIFKVLLSCKEDEYNLETYFEMFDKQREIYGISPKKLSDHEIEMLIIKGILLLTQRFNSEDIAYRNMGEYINTGVLKYITSNEGLRNTYKNFKFDELCRDFISRKGTTVDNYLLNLKNKLHEDYNILVKRSYDMPRAKERYETNLEYLKFLRDYYSGELMSGKKTGSK